MNIFQKLKTLTAPFRLKARFFYQNNVGKKKFLAFLFISAYAPFIIFSAWQSPKETSLFFSKITEQLSDLTVPVFTRGLLYGAYTKYYGVNTEEMTKKFQQYKCFSQFFTRKIKQRQIYKQQNSIVSPADSKVLAFGQISEDAVFVLKGYSYSLGHLLCGEKVKFTQQDVQNIKKDKNNKLFHVILYLAPGDYHRFHSASNFEVVRRKAIEGALYSVNQKSLQKRGSVYQQNSRLILHGKWKQGYLGMILVGALNVGRIVVKEKLIYATGEEIGYFSLGSTIVLLIESPNMEWNIQNQKKVKYGQKLGNVKVKVTV